MLTRLEIILLVGEATVSLKIIGAFHLYLEVGISDLQVGNFSKVVFCSGKVG